MAVSPRRGELSVSETHPKDKMQANSPGPIVLFGSGETAATGRKTWDSLFARMPKPIRVSILETPAGFQPNSARVAGRIAEFIRKRLQNYEPYVASIPARQRDTPFSPDNATILKPMLSSNVLFAGPGSPTYAVRQLKESLAWHILNARHRMGAALVLASAAVVAVGTYTLPVYEIYKVGEDLHWQDGLDLLGPYNLPMVFVPHWNNTEGGTDLDTSHCFVGQERFERLRRLLPPGIPIVGLDEHTTLTIELADEQCRVSGIGAVTVLRGEEQERFPAPHVFPLTHLGELRVPTDVLGDIPSAVLTLIQDAQGAESEAETVPSDVLALLGQREDARRREDWATADRLRDEIAARGWHVSDTPEGPHLEIVPDVPRE